MKTLLKGGIVVSGGGSAQLDVLVDGEKIAQVAEHILCAAANVVDVTGKLLFPGFIDAHTVSYTHLLRCLHPAASRS